MHRRRFLRLLSLVGCLPFTGVARLLRRPPARPGELRFYVAGVRFHPSTGRLEEGLPVVVRAETFGSERCHVVYGPTGERLGYLPKHLARTIEGKNLGNATLSEVRPFAVPWKRLRVTVELA
jgi:hypothetical protein